MRLSGGARGTGSAHSVAHVHTASNGDAFSSAYGNGHTCSGARGNRSAHSGAHGHTIGNGAACSDAHGYTAGNGDACSDAHGNGNTYAVTHCDSHAQAAIGADGRLHCRADFRERAIGPSVPRHVHRETHPMGLAVWRPQLQ